MTDAALATLDRWQAHPVSRPVWIDQEMMRLTLTIAGQALFSVDLSGEASALGQAFTHTSEYVNYRFGVLFPTPLFIPTAHNRNVRRAIRTLDEVIYGMIRERRQSGADTADTGDLLSMLMQARDEDTGEGMTDEQLRNEIATMMFAGHETTAATLTWAFYLLSQHPEVEGKLHAELAEVLGDRAPSMPDLPNLPYNRMVIEETMRLYPPAWGATRQSIEADEIGGYYLPPNSSVSLVFNNVHRDARWWDDPEKFDPERFTPERSADRPSFAYAPFGGGPRLCIGNMFALTEAQLVLATLAQRYQLRLAPGHPVRPNPIFVLRTSDGLPMYLQRREKN
jgi:cytochrome P450